MKERNKPAVVRGAHRGKSERHSDYALGPSVLVESDAYRAPRTAGGAVIQAKLRIATANDPYEKEADRVAETIAHGHLWKFPSRLGNRAEGGGDREQAGAPYSAPGQVIQRNGQKRKREEHEGTVEGLSQDAPGKKLKAEEGIYSVQLDKDYDSARFDETGLVSKGKGYLYRKFESATDPAGGTDAVPALENGISMARGGGEPLPRDLRHGMERALGADFSDVKIHHDKRADRLNRMVDARAFTTNQHVFFQKGAYNPGTSAGKRLIAHELTHVVQQNRGLVSRYHLDQSSTEGEASGTPLRSVKSEMQRAAGYLPATSYGQYGVGAAGGLPDPGGIVAGAAFTAGQKTAIYAQNNVWTAGGMWPVNNGPALGALPAPPPYHEELNDTNLWKQVNLQVGISQVDHIYPKNLGGLNSYKNAQILAAPDNNAKKNVYPWAKQAAVYSGTRVMVTTKSQNVPAGTILDVYGVKKAGVTAAAGNPVIKIPAPTPPSAAVLAVGLPKVAMTLAGFTYINYKTAKGFGLADPNNPPVP